MKRLPNQSANGIKYVTPLTPKGNSSYSYISLYEANQRARYLDQGNCTNCIECINCVNCKNCKGCTELKNCENCEQCYDCFGSQNLRGRIGVIYNGRGFPLAHPYSPSNYNP